MQNKHWSNME
ncbi:UNVERIFIED_CONTAM: hypothetical protein GTU68_051730 [Idotea baltica]|nr:hypothetical protein [Idotea baltica]